MSAPDPDLLEDKAVQQGYMRAGTDHEGTRLGRPVQTLVRALVRGNLGRVAVRVGDVESTIVVQHNSRRTWVALLVFWELGLTIYSRWDEVATIHLEQAPVTEDFLRVVQSAQRLSAQRPATRGGGPDFLDPKRPTLQVGETEVEVEPEDWLDRLFDRFRRLFG